MNGRVILESRLDNLKVNDIEKIDSSTSKEIWRILRLKPDSKPVKINF